jgi:hypothetical protein
MIDNPGMSVGVSVRCKKGHHCHKGKRWGCRCSVLQCSCQCHTTQPPVVLKSIYARGESTAIVRVVAASGKDKAKMIPAHLSGCSNKPCVCSDIRAGRAAKSAIVGLGRLLIEALLTPPKSMKDVSVDDKGSVVKKADGDA